MLTSKLFELLKFLSKNAQARTNSFGLGSRVPGKPVYGQRLWAKPETVHTPSFPVSGGPLKRTARSTPLNPKLARHSSCTGLGVHG